MTIHKYIKIFDKNIKLLPSLSINNKNNKSTFFQSISLRHRLDIFLLKILSQTNSFDYE